MLVVVRRSVVFPAGVPEELDKDGKIKGQSSGAADQEWYGFNKRVAGIVWVGQDACRVREVATGGENKQGRRKTFDRLALVIFANLGDARQ